MKFTRMSIILVALMAGCATLTPPPTPLASVPTGLTDVYVVYETSPSCASSTLALRLDGALVGLLTSDREQYLGAHEQYLRFSMPPGTHQLSATDTHKPNKTLSVPLNGSAGSRLVIGVKEWGFNCAPPELFEITESDFNNQRAYIRQALGAMPPASNSKPEVQPSPARTGAPALTVDEQHHFNQVLKQGKPDQLYFLAIIMTNKGHQDLAMKLYQRMVDKYPDDIYTAKAIEKMDHGFQPAAVSGPAAGGGGMGLSSQQLAHAREAHDACAALCESQSKQCNGHALGSAASSTMSYMNSVVSGDVVGMLSNLGGAAASATTDCDTPLRACVAACPMDPTAPAGNDAQAPATNGAMK